MKFITFAPFLLVLGACAVQAQTSPVAAPQPGGSAAVDYSVVDQDGNSRVWQRTEMETGPDGQTYPHIQRYTELRTGLNFLDARGNWQPSVEQITLQPDGSAAATQGQHKVHFPANILAGAIQLTMPDGAQAESQPAILALYDGTNTAFIGVLTNSVGQLVGSNEVVYGDAFAGIKADLQYTYTLQGFEQDVVLHQRPPAPETLGLDPAVTRLQVWTEFLTAPRPGIRWRRMPTEGGLSLVDEDLNFGQMRMVPGHAFVLPGGAPRALVSKSWITISGRTFLVEEIPLQALVGQMSGLSLGTQPGKHRLWANRGGCQWAIPGRRDRHPDHDRFRVATANAPSNQALVMDYQTVNGSVTNLTFQSDTTYYISGGLAAFGTNIIEGGTVLKYASGASVAFENVETATDRYRPAVLTAKDDNTVGQTISGSTGQPTNYYASTAIMLSSQLNGLSNLRINHAEAAVQCGGVINLSDVQVEHCAEGLVLSGGYESLTANLFNCLMNDCLIGFNLGPQYDAPTSISAQNTTFVAGPEMNGGQRLFYLGSFVDYAAAMTNCVLANMDGTNYLGPLHGDFNGIYPATYGLGTSDVESSTNPFQTAGGGAFYLAATCPFHAAGTTNIDPGLLAELSQKTTYPPKIFTNVTFASPVSFAPQAMRDAGSSPDVGWHYDALDYAFGGCTAQNNLTFAPGTAVGWFRTSAGWYHAGDGIQMSGNVVVNFTGTVTAPDYWVRLNTVQEADATAGYGHGGIENWAGPDAPLVSGRFLKCAVLASEPMNGFFDDDYGSITSQMTDCEFYSGALSTYGDYMYFTNCLMRRLVMGLVNGGPGDVRLLRNCTFVGGSFSVNRNSGGPALVSVRDTAFDGTAISTGDYYGTNPLYSDFNHNAYTNSVDPFAIGGANDVKAVSSFNWQSSWFGDNYLPSDSRLIQAGSINANFVGLYHFTTQTNQIPETNAVVDIGYHYVAADLSGNPLDTNGDGVPDYIEDSNGDGVFDAGDLGDWQLGWSAPGSPGYANSALQLFDPRLNSLLP